MSYWYLDSDNVIKLIGVKNAYTDAYVNGGTIVGKLFNEANVQQGTDVTFTYINGTDGDWVGRFPYGEAGSLVVDTNYYMEITITSGGYQGVLRVHRVAAYLGV